MMQLLQRSSITLFITTFLLLFSVPQIFADVDSVSTSLGTTTVNTASTYTIQFNTGSSGALTADSDTIDIIFPTNTTVPGTIGSGSQITVNGNNITIDASGSGQTLTITTPVDLANASAVTVVINTGANSIINPSLPGTTYALDVRTSIETNAISSSDYTITASSSQVSVGSVSLNPDVLAQAAAYTINFDTSSDGALLAGSSTITLTFDAATTISDGSLTGVTVEGIGASSATGNNTAHTITIIPSQTISNSFSDVTVVIPNTALTNPYTAGNYTVTVATSSQPTTGSSGNFSIGQSATSVNIDSVSIPTNTIGNTSSYDIRIDIPTTASLPGTLAMTITFPSGTIVPNGALSGVTVEGVAATSATGNSAARTITIDPGQASLSGNNLNIVIPSGNIRNPLTTGTGYNLSLATSTQPSGSSPNYTITTSVTAVNAGTVIPSPSIIGNPSQYTINFNTASDAALVGGSSTITITFDASTTITNGSLSGVTVEGTGASSATGNSAAHSITIIPAQDISGSYSNVTVVVPSTAIINPYSANNYTLTVATSVQPIGGTSNGFDIGKSSTSVNIDSVSIPTNTIGNTSSYDISIDIPSEAALSGTLTVQITFPSDTAVLNGSLSGITVEGVDDTSATGNSTARTITIDPGQASLSGNNLNIVIPSGIIRNPLTTGTGYNLSVVTSTQPAGTSPNYTITTSSTAVSVGTVSPDPATIGNASEYSVNFDTASDGALVGGSSTITITFDAATSISNGSLSGITVEGTGASSATGNSAAHTITVIPAQNISGSSSNITVVIPDSHITNPFTSGTYDLSVSTSVQPSAGTSSSFALGKSSTAVNIDSVAIPINTIGNTSSYDIQIDIATDGELSGSSTITITFPNDATVQNGALAGITVEGVAATSATGNSAARTITIDPSQSVLSGNDRNVFIPSGIIRNPLSTSSFYALSVETTTQPSDNSPFFSITTSSTAVTVTGVVANPPTVKNTSQYTIDFNTAHNGALVGDVSTITINFPSGTTIVNGDLSSYGITVEGVGAYSAQGFGASRRVIIVPNQSIAASTSNVTVVIPNTVITNPAASSDYSLTVATSVQPNSGTSPSYTIGKSTTTVNIDSVNVAPNTIGNIGAYTIQIDLSSDGGLIGSDTITVIFPSDTEVLTSGIIGGVTVNGSTATSAIGDSSADTIVINPLQDLSGGTNNIVLAIPASAVRNPTTASSYALDVSTTIQPMGTSPNYVIAQSVTPLSVGNVTVTPAVVGNNASYTIAFTTSSDGALINGESELTIEFDSATQVQNGAIGGVQVDGVAVSSATGNSSAHTISIVIGTDIAGNTSSNIFVPASAIRNPAVAGDYNLEVTSSVQPTGTSSNFTLGQSATPLTVGPVNLSRAVIGNPSQYTINVTTGSEGALVGGISNFLITFPAGTIVPDGALANVTVDGTPASSASSNSSARTVSIVPQQSISPNDSLDIVIGGNQIINPTATRSYDLTVESSAQPVGTSNSYSIGTSATPLDLDAVLVSPNTIRNQGQYNISVTLASDGRLFSGSSINFTFPIDTLVSNGSLSGITVNGFAASSATGNQAARTITIIVGQAVSRGTSFNIVIPAAAVRNPTTIGSAYTITGTTTVQPSAGTSNSYAIGQSATNVSVSSVTPNPNTIGNPAQYTINFSTSNDSALLNGFGQTISVTFPNGTSVSNGSLSGVLLNGTSTSATGDSASRVITISVNQDIAAGSPVTVVLPSSALINPVTQNNYQLTVATSVQPAGISPQYFIGVSTTLLTINSVTPSPATVGNSADYTISATTSSDGALTAGSSSILISFPNDTLVPNGALSNISVNGITASSATGNTAGRTITIVPAAVINASTTFNIVIPQNLNPSSEDVRNPTSAGNYTLAVGTSAQPAGTSPSYTIGQSTTSIQVTNIALSDAKVGSDSDYTIDFNISSDGSLVGDASRIVITFPIDTKVTNGPLSGVTVKGTPAFSATGNSSNRTVTVIPDQDLTGPDVVTVLMPSPAIQNPSTAGSYNLTVWTSPQPAGNLNYDITLSGSPITTGSVSLTNAVVSQLAGYTANISTDTVIRSNRGAFFMVFPVNAIVPSGAISGVTIDGIGADSAVGDGTTRTITIVPSIDVNSGTFNLVIPNSTITNPSIPTVPLPLGVSSTAQALGSTTFTLTPNGSGSTLTEDFPVTVTPSDAGLAATYQLDLTTGSNGRLGPGNIISLTFQSDTTVPATLPAGSITVDGIGTTGTTYASGLIVRFMVPTGVSIGNNTAFVVRILATSGVRNPSSGVYQIDDVYSDSEPTAVQSDAFEISADSQINPPLVTLTPDSIFANTEIAVTFTLGASGSLNMGVSDIFLEFPTTFTLPSTFAASNVTVNGVPVSIASIINGNRFRLRSPISIAAGASNKTITVTFASGVGIANPQYPGSYTITGYTSFETTPITSSSFTVQTSATTISQPMVDIFPAFTNSKCRINFEFIMGSLGRLEGGLSTIVIEFPNEWQLDNIASLAAGSILVNDLPTTSTATLSGRLLTITVPESIGFAGTVRVQLPSSLNIQNPVTEGTYNFSVYTSTEPMPILSNNIFIKRATWEDVVTYPNPLIKNKSVNKAFTWLFIPDLEATLRLYTIDGRLVRKLVKAPNSDRIVWNLLNEKNSEIASGVYIYIIKGSSGEKKGKIAYQK